MMVAPMPLGRQTLPAPEDRAYRLAKTALKAVSSDMEIEFSILLHMRCE